MNDRCIKEIDVWFEINQLRVKQGEEPRNYKLFIVSREIFEELEIKGIGLKSIGSFASRGYHNFMYNGIPVIWDESISDRGVVAIENDLLEAIRCQMS